MERDRDGVYVGSVPELPGCHTQAGTVDELMMRMREAVELYMEVEEGGRERGRRHRFSLFSGLFSCSEAFSGFLGGDFHGLVSVECSLFDGGVVMGNSFKLGKKIIIKKYQASYILYTPSLI
ncbi:MAG: type II toxin-antitoxin system HicB family antitoxin [Candidatus Bathyarchaeota archaeon]